MFKSCKLKRKKRVPAKRLKPRRVRTMCSKGHPRERLSGEARTARRREIFERANGRCEEVISWSTETQASYGNGTYGHVIAHHFKTRCQNKATEWSHFRHGANKCDHLNCGIASCKACHDRRHRPKACPPKVNTSANVTSLAVGGTST